MLILALFAGLLVVSALRFMQALCCALRDLPASNQNWAWY